MSIDYAKANEKKNGGVKFQTNTTGLSFSHVGVKKAVSQTAEQIGKFRTEIEDISASSVTGASAYDNNVVTTALSNVQEIEEISKEQLDKWLSSLIESYRSCRLKNIR